MTLRRVPAAAYALLVAALLAAATAADASAEATWRLEQPAAPPPTPGAAPAPFPVPLGQIGDIAFARQNRGALITAGNGPVEKGVYIYDGAAWRQFATVCGGSPGRLAWAGPDVLWTVSDQRPGQRSTLPLSFDDRSLCRFAGGRVEASYATPQGRPDSYQPMRAAACRAAGDCWFGGELLPIPPPFGAFHLRWDGTALTAVPSAAAPVNDDPAHAVVDVAVYQDGYVESVAVRTDDPVNPAAPGHEQTPALLHLLGTDLSAPFLPLPLPLDLGRTPSGAVIRPADLAGFRLAADGDVLWAISGAASDRAHVVAMRLLPGGVTEQVAFGPSSPFPFGTRVTDVAAEPGTGAVWVAYVAPDAPGDSAQVARIDADGTVGRIDLVPALGDPIGPKGTASRIACPAAGDCWLATSRGWLFHLTDGTPAARDTDPAFAGPITVRPPDGGVPFQPPVDLPVDDSLRNQLPAEEPPNGGDEPAQRTSRRARRPRPLVSDVDTDLVRGTTTLAVTFRLSAKARVRVVARRRGAIVARTPVRRLGKGRHRLRLRLDRRRWPTRLAIDAKPLRGAARGASLVSAPALRGAAR